MFSRDAFWTPFGSSRLPLPHNFSQRQYPILFFGPSVTEITAGELGNFPGSGGVPHSLTLFIPLYRHLAIDM